MAQAHTILVFGGTGKQGCGVVQGLLRLQDTTLMVRVMTRDKASAKVKEMEEKYKGQNVEFVEGNVEDEKALEKAMAGVQGVFLNLDFWQLGAEREIAAGKLIADVASKFGVSHFVYSSLEPCAKKSNGRFPFLAFDTKTSISEYILSKNLPVSFVKFATYMENFMDGHTKLIKNEKGEFLFRYPLEGTGMTLVPVLDAGNVIARIFQRKNEFLGKSIGLAGDHLTIQQMVHIFTEVTGEKAVGQDITIEEWVGTRDPSVGNMYRYKKEFEEDFKDYVQQSRSIYPHIQNFKEWLKENWKAKIQ